MTRKRRKQPGSFIIHSPISVPECYRPKPATFSGLAGFTRQPTRVTYTPAVSEVPGTVTEGTESGAIPLQESTTGSSSEQGMVQSEPKSHYEQSVEYDDSVLRRKLNSGSFQLNPRAKLSQTYPGLCDPYGTYSFINSAIQCLKAVLSPEDKTQLIEKWQAAGRERPGQVIEGFCRLLDLMENQPHEQNLINKALEELIQLCRKDPRFQTILREEEAISEGQVQKGEDPEGFDLGDLAPNDGHLFLRELEGVLSESLGTRDELLVKTSRKTRVGDTILFNKLAADIYTSHLLIPLHNSGSLQDSIEQSYGDKSVDEGENQPWSAGFYKTAGDRYKYCEGGEFPTVVATRLVASPGELNMFSLCVSEASASMNSPEVYENFVETAFNPIEVNVLDHESPSRVVKLKAKPVCIIAFKGSNPERANYVSAIKERDGWVVLENDVRPRTARAPDSLFKNTKRVPYVIYYRVAEKKGA